MLLNKLRSLVLYAHTAHMDIQDQDLPWTTQTDWEPLTQLKMHFMQYRHFMQM